MPKSQLPTSRAKTAYGLLSDIAKLIVAEPKRYNQTWWLARRNDPRNVYEPGKSYPTCGTVGCVAGWIATLTKRTDYAYVRDLEDVAADVLGLDSHTAMDLFNGVVVDGEPQTLSHARSGARHIRKFQRKYRAQLLAKKV